MSSLDDLYKEIILDHYRSPRNQGELDPPAHRCEGFNPLCGDEVIVFVSLIDQKIEDIRIGGQGCSISQASASMMTEIIKGKSISEAERIIHAFKPGKNLGIHAHNDTGNAVANSLSAVLSGVKQIQGTINGLGERCGNANLMSVIPTLHLKETYSKKYEINIKKENIGKLTQCSRLLDEILNRKPNQHLPYVGAAAFSHKGGLHVSAVQKDPKTYEHIDPEEVGNVRNIVVSDQSGKSNIVSRLNSIGIDFKQDDPKIKKLLEEVKDREFIGYSYDGADASFELLARRIMGEIPRYISIKEYDVSVKKNSSGEIISSAKAQLEVDKKIILCEGEGNGPVHALDNAIRNNVDKLAKYSQYLKDLKLVDYKVRILNTGTEAVTRVSIESTDSKGKNWFTIGVSTNIIDASFKALVDSLDYKLFKDNAPASL